MSKPAKLLKAEQRVDRAQYALGCAHGTLFTLQADYLEACGWERVWTWPVRQRLWKRPGGAPYTTFAAMREQERIEKRRARDKARKAKAKS